MLRNKIVVSALLLVLLIQNCFLLSCESANYSMAFPPKRSLLIGQNYKDAVMALQKNGFTNVFLRRTAENPDGTTRLTGEVTDVYVGGSTHYDEEQKIASDTEIILVYFMDDTKKGEDATPQQDPSPSQDPDAPSQSDEPNTPTPTEPTEPEKPDESGQQEGTDGTTDTPGEDEHPGDNPETTYVWVSGNGGKRYHRSSECSGMKNPTRVSLAEAQASGFTPCKRCYKNSTDTLE